ncbi:hypothetical protein LP114_06685 [Moraxella bovis]|uniref:hypothetical protein n=1 Tax=Moraxella bovis TaxID=476 RepID=UPI00222742E2|nr:hypothetical protein [Moraxella bovis]UYZ90342.1 hypothetical protein LP114_04520 [Moraxella bovis]UYZ90739.1 hypothetical protein LP114_06685 [Moraxella bovis]UZA09719.1 hypothetical protein LP108_04720 [Moraxella bovis]UZA10117.1 hypothetical protein LP108_06880 [Moraxella bovis]UZA47808.1 hypothetical protein LP100_09180 [Moraxella bovis]
MKLSDIIGGAIAYIALVVITYQCIFGWAEHTADDNSRVAQAQAETYISHADKVMIEMMKSGDEK